MSLTLSLFITSFVVAGSWEVALNLEFNSASKINFAHNRSIMVIGAVGIMKHINILTVDSPSMISVVYIRCHGPVNTPHILR